MLELRPPSPPVPPAPAPPAVDRAGTYVSTRTPPDPRLHPRPRREVAPPRELGDGSALERQMEALRRGAGLVAVIPVPSRDSSRLIPGGSSLA